MPVLGAISHPAKTSHQQSSTTCKTPHCCLFSQGADSYFWIFPYNTASFCTIDSHFCKMLWKPCTCLFNNTIVITLANCFSLELGLWDVVIIILGSRTPAQAYSSSWWEPVSKHTQVNNWLPYYPFVNSRYSKGFRGRIWMSKPPPSTPLVKPADSLTLSPLKWLTCNFSIHHTLDSYIIQKTGNKHTQIYQVVVILI